MPKQAPPDQKQGRASLPERWTMTDAERADFISKMHSSGVGMSWKENSGVTIDDVVACAKRAATDGTVVTDSIKKSTRRG